MYKMITFTLLFLGVALAGCSSDKSATGPVSDPVSETESLRVVEFAVSEDFEETADWNQKQGIDSYRCDKQGESPERTADGWMHWIVNQASGITQAELVLGGSGEGTYQPTKYGSVVEFFTPYYDLIAGDFEFDAEGKPIIEVEDIILTATLHYNGTWDGNFVLSDYCPGVGKSLEVSKTVVTSFTREHFWDIDKSVGTENGYTVYDDIAKIWLYIDGSGDETATWTVDVTYEGYEDSDFNVSGVITIENVGTSGKVIESVEDVLGGTIIDVDCGVTFPYTLEVGEELVCTYDEDGYVEGDNVVTVVVGGEDDPYTDTVAIVWGDPTKEINKTVNIEDISDLFGEVDLGTVAAPDDAKFTYTKNFAWADYGEGETRGFTYGNTATIVETEQSAEATLKVNVQGFKYDTAYAKGDDAICFIPTFNNWGWTNPIGPGTYEWPLWAGAAQCDTDKGMLVGSVEVVYDAEGYVSVTYNVEAPYILDETHVYAGTTEFPQQARGRRTVDTVAPGQYYNDSPFDGSEVYVIAHAVVGYPDPNFGP